MSLGLRPYPRRTAQSLRRGCRPTGVTLTQYCLPWRVVHRLLHVRPRVIVHLGRRNVSCRTTLVISISFAETSATRRRTRMTTSSIASWLVLHPDRGSGAPTNASFRTDSVCLEFSNLVFQHRPRQGLLGLSLRPEPARVQGSEGMWRPSPHTWLWPRGGVGTPPSVLPRSLHLSHATSVMDVGSSALSCE